MTQNLNTAEPVVPSEPIEPGQQGQTEPIDSGSTDYKVQYEALLKQNEELKLAQSGSDRKVSELAAKIKELELSQLSDKERDAKIREQEKLELEQLRVDKKLMENKAFALEHASKAKLPAELVENIDLNLDRDKILENVLGLEKAVQKIKDSAIEEFKNDNRPGFKSSIAFDETKQLTVDQLMKMKKEAPEKYAGLPEHLKKPTKQSPLLF